MILKPGQESAEALSYLSMDDERFIKKGTHRGLGGSGGGGGGSGGGGGGWGLCE